MKTFYIVLFIIFGAGLAVIHNEQDRTRKLNLEKYSKELVEFSAAIDTFNNWLKVQDSIVLSLKNQIIEAKLSKEQKKKYLDSLENEIVEQGSLRRSLECNVWDKQIAIKNIRDLDPTMTEIAQYDLGKHMKF